MKNLKTAIVVDSGSGIKNNTIKDVYVVPMIVVKVENKHETSYRDGIDITSKEIVEDMLAGIVYKTASPVMGECTELIEKLAKEYDEVYILSMPQPVSGTYNQWKLIASDYENVYVYNTMAPGHNMKWLLEDIQKIKNVNHEKVEALANDHYKKTNIGLVVRDLKYAIRGGRVGIIKGGIAILLKLNVVLDLTAHGFENVGTTNKVEKIFPIVAKVLQDQCGYNGNNIERLCIYTSNTKDPKFNCAAVAKELKNGFGFKGVEFAEFPPVFISHAGPNYVGFSIKVK